MFQSIASAIVAFATFVGSLFGLSSGNLGTTNPVAGTNYYLSGSGVSSSATSITLTSLTIPQTGRKLVDGDFSDTFYITLEPGSRTSQEIASCTTVTQNANNTATLSGCSRGLLPFSPYTASSTYAFPHGGGTVMVFSNAPQLYNEFAAKGNDETITGTWVFPEPTSASSTATKNYTDTNFLSKTSTTSQTVASQVTINNNLVATGTLNVTGQSTFTLAPITSDTPDSGNELVNKTYADALAIAGSPTMTTSTPGIAKLSLDPASSTNPIVVGDNDPRLIIEDETASTTTMLPTPAAKTLFTIAVSQVNSSSTFYTALYDVPHPMSVNDISFSINAVGSAGTINAGIYDISGNLLASTSTTVTTPTTKTMSFASTLELDSGYYYIGIAPTSTTDLTFVRWNISGLSSSEILTSATPRYVGTLSITPDSLPASFNPSSITFNTAYLWVVRLDN